MMKSKAQAGVKGKGHDKEQRPEADTNARTSQCKVPTREKAQTRAKAMVKAMG
jgi:hypothetical protein